MESTWPTGELVGGTRVHGWVSEWVGKRVREGGRVGERVGE